MKKDFTAKNWMEYLPQPICEEFPQYENFYKKAWELAHDHIREIPNMPQTPYMDEAFCDTQIWIWDTCFMSLFCKFAQEVFPGVESFNNFYSVLYEGIALPEIIPTEDEPWWTETTPGVPTNIKVHLADNPPLFAWGEYENALFHGDREYLSDLLYNRKILQKHYEWVESLEKKVLLPGVARITFLKKADRGYQWEGGCSGMDNTPRGRNGKCTELERPNNPDMLWIDAICQQALSARMIAQMFDFLEDNEHAQAWQAKYEEKSKLVNDLYWDEEDKFYYDIDVNDLHFYKVPTIASYWTLTAGIATKERAKILAERIMDDKWFGGDVPLVSLARKDANFVNEGQYWRGSLWLPTAYAALKGLVEYGFYEEAHIAGHKIFNHMMNVYNQYEPHTIWECYSPTECKPATQTDNITIVRPDFCGWSALGPIAIYLECVLGFYKIDAFNNIVEWAKPTTFKGKIGVKNLRFGDIIADIVANEEMIYVKTNRPFTLKVNGKLFEINVGENVFENNRR